MENRATNILEEDKKIMARCNKYFEHMLNTNQMMQEQEEEEGRRAENYRTGRGSNNKSNNKSKIKKKGRP